MNAALAGRRCCILTAVFNDWPSAAYLIPLLDRLLGELGLKASVVVVDDASTDVTGEGRLPGLDLAVVDYIDVIRLASNQGNQRALAIGVAYIANHVSCDYLLVLDSDLEDKPEDVPSLLAACADANDTRVIFAERSKRSEGQAFRLFYTIYKVLNRLLTGTTITVGNFSVIPGSLIRRLAHIAELWTHFPASIIRAGVPYAKVPSERGKRIFGHGKMSLIRLVVHAFSSFAVYADVVAVRIMLFALMLGIGFLAVFIAGSALWYSTDILVPGWTSHFLMQVLTLFAVVLGTATVVIFTALALRMQPPMIPFHDYIRFVVEIARPYSATNRVCERRANS